MTQFDPIAGAIILGVGVVIGAALVAAGVMAGYWISARSRGEASPIAGEPKPPVIEQEDTD